VLTPILKRGALAGLAGGAAAAVVLLALGEQAITRAIEIEASQQIGETAAPLVTRREQLVGGSLGLLILGVVYGLVFATVFYLLRDRLTGKDDWRRSLTLAGMCFVGAWLVPFFKIPSNPPAVGDPDTVGQRTTIYLGMVLISLVAMALAWHLAQRLAARQWSEPARLTAAVAAWVAMITLAMVVVPPNRDAITIDPKLLWEFRLATAAGQATMWAVMGTVFGLLVLRAEAVIPGRSGPASQPGRIDATDTVDASTTAART
jgi:hypothetical protein